MVIIIPNLYHFYLLSIHYHHFQPPVSPIISSSPHIRRRVNDLFGEESPITVSFKLSPFIRYIAIPILSLTSPNRPLAGLLASNVFPMDLFAKIHLPKWSSHNDVISFYEYVIAIATYQPAVYTFLENQGIFRPLEGIRAVGIAVYRSILLLLRERPNKSISSITKSFECFEDSNQIYGTSFQIYCSTLSKSECFIGLNTIINRFGVIVF